MKNNHMNKENLLTLRYEIATPAIKHWRTRNDSLRLFRQVNADYFSERYLLITNFLFFPLCFPCFAYR